MKELPAGGELGCPLSCSCDTVIGVQETLRALFRPRGKVHRVTISSRASQKHHNTAARRLYHASSTDDYTMFAHIVFKDPASLTSALAVDTNAPPALASSTTMRPCGADAWLAEHRNLFPNRRALQAEVDQSVAAYEEAEAKVRDGLVGSDGCTANRIDELRGLQDRNWARTASRLGS
jgi:hypothetical protein